VIELADTSALVLAKRHDEPRRWLVGAAQRDEAAICDMVELEYLMGAQSADGYRRMELAFEGFHRYPTLPDDWSRARDVHRRLAQSGAGHQRSVQIPDLIIAAVAERNDVAIVHYDEDYERIAAITGQATRWVAPRGTY
jgi:predicted nucleic acid-binding protein